MLERTAELEAERARLAAVVEHVPAGLLIFSTDGSVLSRNEQALRILNIEARHLSHVSSFASWPSWRVDGTPYGADEWPLARTMRTGEIVTGERVELARPNGARVVLDVSTAPVLDAAGHVIGSVAIFHDVTTRDRRERAERDFVTNAAHELQSPLAAIVSAIEVLQGGAKDTPERDLFLGHVEREVGRLTRLVHALLILARVQTGEEQPRQDLVPLCPLLEDIAGTLHPPSGVDVVVNCPNDLAAVTTRPLLQQALENLGRNAVRHTHRGRVELGARERAGRIEVSVIDTGSGIPAVERARVFDRFYRPADEQTRPRDGFGLGLAIVRAAIDALGGEIELDSTVGSGTIVRLRLPTPATLVES